MQPMLCLELGGRGRVVALREVGWWGAVGVPAEVCFVASMRAEKDMMVGVDSFLSVSAEHVCDSGAPWLIGRGW